MIAIQWEDVIGVLQTCKPYLIALGVLWIAAVIVMIVCMKVKKKSKKRMIRKYSALSMLVSLIVIVNMIVLGPMYAMINLTKVGGITSDETTEEARNPSDQRSVQHQPVRLVLSQSGIRRDRIRRTQ